MADAPVRLYFHGLPGDAGELGLFGAPVTSGLATSGLTVVDRRVMADAAGFEALAESIRARHPGRPLHLVGFSLGAHAALRVAARLGAQVAGLDLVSAAAPLQLGPYLDGMAGGPLFRLARDRPWLFGLAVRAQGLAARRAPERLFSALFARAAGADRALAADPAFRAAVKAMLARSLGAEGRVYRREICLYVGDWRTELAEVAAPVRLHHGTHDSWSPPDMARDLARALPAAQLEMHEGLSHYSTLGAYLATAAVHG